MITPINKPNFTYIEHLQSLWILNPLSCGRPPWSISIPIICTTSNSSVKDPWIIDQGTDYNMQSSCCPTGDWYYEPWITFPTNDTGASFFSSRSDCAANYCYLTDEATAHAFGECIEEASRKLVEKGRKEGTLRNNATTPREFFGTCEYIDYDALRGPAVQGVGYVKPKQSDAAPVDILSVKAMMSVVGLGLFVIGSGLF